MVNALSSVDGLHEFCRLISDIFKGHSDTGYAVARQRLILIIRPDSPVQRKRDVHCLTRERGHVANRERVALHSLRGGGRRRHC